MNYKVKLFASLKDKFGSDMWEYKSSTEIKASELLDIFFKSNSDLSHLKKITRIAVNQTFCAEDVVLKDSDELALIPPVSGG